MQKMINEMLKEISSSSTEKQKIDLLRKYDCQALREVLKYAYDENLSFFTSEVPQYKTDTNTPVGMSFNSLYNESRRFYILTKPEVEKNITKGKTTTLQRKNQILLQILENIHPEEAKVLESLVKRDFNKKYNLNKTVIKKAYPNIIL